MQEFYTDWNKEQFFHCFAALQCSHFARKPLYCIDVVREIFHYTLFDEKEHTVSNAAKNGQLKVLEYLVARGENIQLGDDYIFRVACKNGRLNIIKYLVLVGGNIHYNEDWAICLASEHGHLEVVKYLVERGANVSALDNLAIKKASCGGHLEIIKYLEECGATICSQVLEWANCGHLEVVKYLVSCGANVRAKDNYAI